MQIMTLIAALPGAVAQGLIWGIMAIGVYITFRTLDIADLTVDGSIGTGGAVCAMMLLSGHNVFVSMLVATLAGMVAGLITGIFPIVGCISGDSTFSCLWNSSHLQIALLRKHFKTGKEAFFFYICRK